MIDDAPQMPLILQENFTVKLLESLRQGEIDVAILADPFPDTGLMTPGGVRRTLRGRGAALARLGAPQVDRLGRN